MSNNDDNIIKTNINAEVDKQLGPSTLNFSLRDAAETGDVKIQQTTIIGASQENNQLRGLGERLCPDGFEYAGSAAMHLYSKRKLDGSYEGVNMEQVCLDGLEEKFVSVGLKLLSVAVATKYGWQGSKQAASVIKTS